jgi:hypothetical protein
LLLYDISSLVACLTFLIMLVKYTRRYCRLHKAISDEYNVGWGVAPPIHSNQCMWRSLSAIDFVSITIVFTCLTDWIDVCYLSGLIVTCGCPATFLCGCGTGYGRISFCTTSWNYFIPCKCINLATELYIKIISKNVKSLKSEAYLS